MKSGERRRIPQQCSQAARQGHPGGLDEESRCTDLLSQAPHVRGQYRDPAGFRQRDNSGLARLPVGQDDQPCALERVGDRIFGNPSSVDICPERAECGERFLHFCIARGLPDDPESGRSVVRIERRPGLGEEIQSLIRAHTAEKEDEPLGIPQVVEDDVRAEWHDIDRGAGPTPCQSRHVVGRGDEPSRRTHPESFRCLHSTVTITGVGDGVVDDRDHGNSGAPQCGPGERAHGVDHCLQNDVGPMKPDEFSDR